MFHTARFLQQTNISLKGSRVQTSLRKMLRFKSTGISMRRRRQWKGFILVFSSCQIQFRWKRFKIKQKKKQESNWEGEQLNPENCIT